MKHRITLEPFGVSFECEEGESILDAALRGGIALRYGCKHGGCGTCKARILDGEVDLEKASDFALMDYERDAGLALLCSAIPLEDVVVQLDDDYEEAQLYAGIPIREFNARIEIKRGLTLDIWFLRLSLEAPTTMEFKAGQYVEVQVPGTDQWRAFSMANSPSDDDHVELMIKVLPGGLFSSLLSGLEVGTVLQLRGPFGQFALSDSAAPIIMVAGGSGMAPLAAMLQTLAEQNSARDIVFYYGARTAQDLFWLDELKALTSRLKACRFIPALSAAASAEWRGETGLVTEVLARRTDALRGSEAYLCGPPAMIDAAIAVLRAKGMFSARIRFDKFVSTAK